MKKIYIKPCVCNVITLQDALCLSVSNVEAGKDDGVLDMQVKEESDMTISGSHNLWDEEW